MICELQLSHQKYEKKDKSMRGWYVFVLWECLKRRELCDLHHKALIKKAATYSPTCAVPSALRGLTSLFGMGRGGTPSL